MHFLKTKSIIAFMSGKDHKTKKPKITKIELLHRIQRLEAKMSWLSDQIPKHQQDNPENLDAIYKIDME